ncbi:DUF4832 domain-containing protein [Neorhodopirellula pilleata]|uniref:DUF4832 domain-containing protein n=1 Tax=Neorhodopirellula pilleata TaxID=2714738 RepID=A0A5C6AWI3_9BACT|nr:DUF4832 domain-containing protein [Neorhodopirellula pilleata]TWU03392.1 hypothetical protein Pla100_03130 [Neorhodopirellula pilleata]
MFQKHYWLLICVLALMIAEISCGEVLAQRNAPTIKFESGVEWVTVKPNEFRNAINNPLKGFRDFKKDGYGLLKRKYVDWNEIETCEGDSVDRIIAYTNQVTQTHGKSFEEQNIKLVPRVYLDWNGVIGEDGKPQQYWPSDLADFDYDSPEFQRRLRELIAKLGKAWDNDPRIFAVQMGLIGRFGEHHNPTPSSEQRQLLAEAFRSAFKNKPVLVRHTDPEFMDAGFGIYYDTFATLTREPPTEAVGQLPWQATNVYPHIWKRSPIEGEVEYNWQKSRENAMPESTFGRTPDETMEVPAYRDYMIGKIRRYHATYLGWISDYDESNPRSLAGAAEIQKAFGYRFVIDSMSYPLSIEPGQDLAVKLNVRNTGSAPFYLDWPVAVGLLDPVSLKVVWSAPLEGVDIRKWLPGEDWNEQSQAYQVEEEVNTTVGTTGLPKDVASGKYVVALAILDRQGGMTPSVRFAAENYLGGGWHPFGYIGVGGKPESAELSGFEFHSPGFDDTLAYKVPAELREVETPPIPVPVPIARWAPTSLDLINPWRYWNLETNSKTLQKRILANGPTKQPARERVISLEGDFDKGSRLEYSSFEDWKLPPGHYRFSCYVRGTPNTIVDFELGDGWRRVVDPVAIPLSNDWRQHVHEFSVEHIFQEETRLRFRLPDNVKGTFATSDMRLQKLD